MSDHQDFRQQVRAIHRLMLLLFILMGITSAGVLFLLSGPDIRTSFVVTSEVENADMTNNEDDFDIIENGIHVRTGFKEGVGLMEVVNNCTNCHSAQLVIQNRMNAERWQATIRWMQETQNLWDLGKNEEIIIQYLVTNYPPKKKGRRSNLQNIEWYVLED